MDEQLRILLTAAALLVAAVQIPLLLGRVPPNAFYGLRTPRTRRPDIWYPANAFAARAMLAAAAATLLLLWGVPVAAVPTWYPVAAFAVPLLLAVVASLLHLRRYP